MKKTITILLTSKTKYLLEELKYKMRKPMSKVVEILIEEKAKKEKIKYEERKNEEDEDDIEF